MNSRPQLILDSVLHVMRPLARLLMRNGVPYPAFSLALKRVFLEAAQAELANQQMPTTDSAVTLLSGVHRRDVRNLTRGAAPARESGHEPLGLVGQVVARWMSEAPYLDAAGAPRGLMRNDARNDERSSKRASGRIGERKSHAARADFDALVASVSSDVRPRAMLDEMLRLGVVTESAGSLHLVAAGFAPRQGLAETAQLFADNVSDHAAAAAANLQGDANFLEQGIYVDQITAESADAIHKAAVQAWKQAFKTVMHEAQQRFDADAEQADASQRTQRARFGVYFYSDREN
jgi:Family of unknown function (DUF6502)